MHVRFAKGYTQFIGLVKNIVKPYFVIKKSFYLIHVI